MVAGSVYDVNNNELVLGRLPNFSLELAVNPAAGTNAVGAIPGQPIVNFAAEYS